MMSRKEGEGGWSFCDRSTQDFRLRSVKGGGGKKSPTLVRRHLYTEFGLNLLQPSMLLLLEINRLKLSRERIENCLFMNGAHGNSSEKNNLHVSRLFNQFKEV